MLGNVSDNDRLSLQRTLTDDAFARTEPVRELLASRVRVRAGQHELDLTVLNVGEIERAVLRSHDRRQLRVIEESALEEPNTHRFEEPSGNGTCVRTSIDAVRRHGGTRVRKRPIRQIVVWEVTDGARGLHARQRAEAAKELVRQGDCTPAVTVAAVWDGHTERQMGVRLEAWIHVLNRDKGACQQSGADEEHDTDSDLQRDEDGAQPVPKGSGHRSQMGLQRANGSFSEELDDRGQRSGTLAKVSYGVAGALAVGTLVALWLTDPGEEWVELRVGATPTPDGATVGAAWAF